MPRSALSGLVMSYHALGYLGRILEAENLLDREWADSCSTCISTTVAQLNVHHVLEFTCNVIKLRLEIILGNEQAM